MPHSEMVSTGAAGLTPPCEAIQAPFGVLALIPWLRGGEQNRRGASAAASIQHHRLRPFSDRRELHDLPQREPYETSAPVLGDGVYVGAGAVLIGPIRVGDGARIGAGAVVTKDVPAGATAVGVNRIISPSGDTD